MSRWFLLAGTACVLVAAGLFLQSKFIEEFPHSISVFAGLYGGAFVVALALIGFSFLSAKCGQLFNRRGMRCILKVFAYTISAGAFFFTFKISAKADFYHGFNNTITKIREDLSDPSKIINIAKFEDIFKNVTGDCEDIITEFGDIIKNVTVELGDIAKNVTGELDLQFSNTNYILFLDIWTLFSTLCLSLACLFIARAFDNQNRCMDWLFDLLCDLMVHMASDIFGESWRIGLTFYVVAVILIILREAYDPPGDQENQNGVVIDPLVGDAGVENFEGD